MVTNQAQNKKLMITVCLSHDIDRIHKSYQYFTKPFRALKSGDVLLSVKRLFSPFYERNPYWGFDKIIEIENRYGVKSTHFILNENIKINWLKPSTYKLALGRYKITDKHLVRMIRYLDQNGWEIGVHGSYNSYNDVELLKKEKYMLEQIVGHQIIGIRQHYLNLSESTWELQSKVGFLYDSSFGHTKDIGYKDNKITPFFPLNNSYFCEIPLVIMDFPFVNIKDKWKRFEEICKQCERANGYLVINFHNNNFNELDFPGVASDYECVIKKLKEKNARFMTLGQAYEEIIHLKK